MIDKETVVLLVVGSVILSNILQFVLLKNNRALQIAPRKIYVRLTPTFGGHVASYSPDGLLPVGGIDPAQAVGGLILKDPVYVNVEVEVQE